MYTTIANISRGPVGAVEERSPIGKPASPHLRAVLEQRARAAELVANGQWEPLGDIRELEVTVEECGDAKELCAAARTLIGSVPDVLLSKKDAAFIQEHLPSLCDDELPSDIESDLKHLLFRVLDLHRILIDAPKDERASRISCRVDLSNWRDAANDKQARYRAHLWNQLCDAVLGRKDLKHVIAFKDALGFAVGDHPLSLPPIEILRHVPADHYDVADLDTQLPREETFHDRLKALRPASIVVQLHDGLLPAEFVTPGITSIVLNRDQQSKALDWYALFRQIECLKKLNSVWFPRGEWPPIQHLPAGWLYNADRHYPRLIAAQTSSHSLRT